MYAEEEVASNYAYPDEYQLLPIEEQVCTLKQIFRKLNIKKTIEFLKKVFPKLALSLGAEGWFAIPKPEKIGGTYEEALVAVFNAIRSSRELYNYRRGMLGEKYLQQSALALEAFKKFGQTQEGDVLIVPAQFGMLHRGRSIRRARAVFGDNEFGLGAFAVGCMLLTHPARLIRRKQLNVDCAGDEYDGLDDSGNFLLAPMFFCVGDGVEFGAYFLNEARENFGSVSGFLL
jgi:hypothetical protein